MADRINIADKETLDLALTRLTSAVSDLKDILSKIGAADDTTVSTLFGLARLAATDTSIVKAVYRGYQNIGGASSITITHPAVNPDKSVVIFNASPISGNLTDHGVHMTGRTSTTLMFSSRQSATITWQVIEFN